MGNGETNKSQYIQQSLFGMKQYILIKLATREQAEKITIMIRFFIPPFLC